MIYPVKLSLSRMNVITWAGIYPGLWIEQPLKILLNICHTFSNRHTQWQLGIWKMVVQNSTALTLVHLLLKQRRSECASHGDNVMDGASMDFAFLMYFPPKHLKKGWVKLWHAFKFGYWLFISAQEDRNVACQKSQSKFNSRAGVGNIWRAHLSCTEISLPWQRLYKSFKHRNKLVWSPMVQTSTSVSARFVLARQNFWIG